MAKGSIPGIHHVTAIAGDPLRNISFYTEVLGQRLVKKSVNFDDPGTYHLYYGDRTGRPGTILTFFPWPRAPKGRKGFGQPRAVSFAIPFDSLDYWSGRLHEFGISAGAPQQRWDETVIAFQDPDGLNLELVAAQSLPDADVWEGSPVPPERAIRGFHGVTLWELDARPTVAFLTRTMGFEQVADSGERIRLGVPGGEAGGRQVVDIIEAGDALHATVGVGTIHHVAFRAANGPDQVAWRGTLLACGLEVTPIINRQYFHSIYFHEPGGVLLEVATDPPGFTLDEGADELGTHLKLPPQYEPARAKIEALLPPLEPEGRALKEE